MGDLCRNCNIFVGYGGLGVVLPPEDKNKDWLINHCWICERSREEVVEDNAKRFNINLGVM